MAQVYDLSGKIIWPFILVVIPVVSWLGIEVAQKPDRAEMIDMWKAASVYTEDRKLIIQQFESLGRNQEKLFSLIERLQHDVVELKLDVKKANKHPRVE